MVIIDKGVSINYVDKQGEEGIAYCQRYYISLCSKLVNEGGREVKNPQNLVSVVYEFPQIRNGILSGVLKVGFVENMALVPSARHILDLFSRLANQTIEIK